MSNFRGGMGGFGGMNMQNLMRQAQKMQEDIIVLCSFSAWVGPAQYKMPEFPLRPPFAATAHSQTCLRPWLRYHQTAPNIFPKDLHPFEEKTPP